MINISYKTCKYRKAFSLAEVLTALTIGAMVLVAVLTIYGRSENSAAAITNTLDNYRLPSEILQRIAEDLDRIISAGSNTIITVENKFDNGFSTARLKILKNFYDRDDKLQVFEQIIWQTSYNYNSDTAGLILYRSHSGIALEDKLLDEQKETWEQELFIPICDGVTFFSMQASKDQKIQDKWTNSWLPHGIVATISFAEPFKALTGTFEVPENEKFTRTIALDRTRKIEFEIIKETEDQEQDQQSDQEQEQEQEKNL